ncbi:MAG TPA: UPF0158 family protein [Mucilaginibacter sp.]
MPVEIASEIIKQIAEELEMGMLCFYHKTDGSLEVYPDELSNPGFDEEFWEEAMEKVEENPGDYIAFEPMRSSEAFRVMKDFADGIGHIPTKNKFNDVLSQKKPFANFDNMLGYYPDLRQEWFKYKEERYIQHVKDQLETANLDEANEDDE